MKVLILVATRNEGIQMTRLAREAGLDSRFIYCLGLEGKPKMKDLRGFKAELDEHIEAGRYDVVVASGDTAARLAFDKPVVNITKLRGREFEYKPGVRAESRGRKKK
jgi:uracil-DNA glycosylase